MDKKQDADDDGLCSLCILQPAVYGTFRPSIQFYDAALTKDGR